VELLKRYHEKKITCFDNINETDFSSEIFKAIELEDDVGVLTYYSHAGLKRTKYFIYWKDKNG